MEDQCQQLAKCLHEAKEGSEHLKDCELFQGLVQNRFEVAQRQFHGNHQRRCSALGRLCRHLH